MFNRQIENKLSEMNWQMKMNEPLKVRRLTNAEITAMTIEMAEKGIGLEVPFETAEELMADLNSEYDVIDGYKVRFTQDTETGVWTATSEDVPGLVLGSDDLNPLKNRVRQAIPELVELNSGSRTEDNNK